MAEKTKKGISKIAPEKCVFCGKPAELVYDEGKPWGVSVCYEHDHAIRVIGAQDAIGFLQDLLSDKFILPKKIAGKFLIKDFEGLRKELIKRHPLYKVKILKGEHHA